MLGITDSYTAYCVDEAGAWLIRQKKPPGYASDSGMAEKPNLNDPRIREKLIRAGGATMKP